ncbi:MAG: MarR family winged helix-turn-helix transcriptional regulator [Alphaproteobacteria bacterium]|nr:MarR family winged helix-turn-helix transcriptional regulator [Alphaproteobacteria bacterium]
MTERARSPKKDGDANQVTDRPIDRDGAPFDNVLAGIHVLSNLIGRAYDSEIAARWDLSLPEWRIVLTLMHHPGATASQITSLWGMEKMAVSRAARRLERDGRVRRTLHKSDRRRYTLDLTAAGQKLYEQVEPGATARYRDIVDVLEPAERAALHSALSKLITRITELRD